MKGARSPIPSARDRIHAVADEASPSLAKVGRWISAHPIQALSRSAGQLARQVGSSVTAVHRFARAAGFEGFAHLKAVLGEELRTVADSVRKLDGRTRKGSVPIDAGALQAAASGPQLERAAGRMLKAHHVWFLGLGASSHLAGYAVHLLMPYLPRVSLVSGEGGTVSAARRLARCDASDVVVAISLPRYANDTVRLAAFAKERGAKVFGITDALTAPLAPIADTLLLAPSDHALMPSSGLGALAVIEGLATAVMRLNPDALRLAHELSEAVLSHLAPPAVPPAPKKR